MLSLSLGNAVRELNNIMMALAVLLLFVLEARWAETMVYIQQTFTSQCDSIVKIG